MAGPAINKTKEILAEKVPLLRETYWEPSSTPPKQMDRLQAAAGPHKSGNDPHIAGRALDIILFANKPNEQELANNIVKVFLDLKEVMKWSAVIYNKKQWDARGETPRLKNNDPSYEHVTHIHIEWREADMGNTGFEEALRKGLSKIVSGKSYYLYFGGGDPQKIRERKAALELKIKSKGGRITDVLSIWTDGLIKVGEEVPKLPGDPLDTDLEKARMLQVDIFEADEFEKNL